ncbi:hypothetical protein PPERSA_03454 [Pseudocohnilembus persalinus]|uniref:CNNM transmembrane domain-containing protein n=1 Tax=Pseudocohnilembus persalinus TaxID=266149 RepID=A0A0V0QBQ3_PSEPJ|nr:hypothetical protein PPERSA_03454 [Pseudocohnilembus persalinus]|eukprot:KRW99653.1 hypothetical protein PPERSA_03454 [Pseudocohnilembus persalinus]
MIKIKSIFILVILGFILISVNSQEQETGLEKQNLSQLAEEEHLESGENDAELSEQNEEENNEEHESETENGEEQAVSHASSKYSYLEPMFYFSAIMATTLVTLAGLFSGLTVGLTSIDKLALEIKMNNGTKEDIEAGNAILPILNNYHILISTLLIANAICMEALPIFLNSIVPAYAAIIISTVAVVVVGEIIPQAYCTGPQQLQIAQKMAPLVRIMIIVLKPFTYFIAKQLDRILGADRDENYDQDQIRIMVSLYESMIPKCLNCQLIVEKQVNSNGKDFNCKRCEQTKVNEQNYFICKNSCFGQAICEQCYDSAAFLYSTEITVIKGVLDKIETKEQKEKQGQEFVKVNLSENKGFVPIEKAVMVTEHDKINRKSLEKITKKCYSSLFVRNKNKNEIIGIVKIKNLIQFFDSDSQHEFKSRMYTNLNFVPNDISYLDLINSFKDTSSDVAIVYENNSVFNLNKEDSKKNQAQRFQEEMKNQYNVENYSSLVPTNQVLQRNKQNKQELEYNGNKILGIYTIKDIFEDLINLDFGESQKDDQLLQERMHEEIQESNQKAYPLADPTTNSLLSLMRVDDSRPIAKIVQKASNKFKSNLLKRKQKEESEAIDVAQPEIENKKRSQTQFKR